MRLAYLLNRYPAVSHSFIRREILALERGGQDVFRIALRGWQDEALGLDDKTELARTHYVLQRGGIPLLVGCLQLLVTRPIKFARAVALVCKIGRKADRPLTIHFIYLLEACLVVKWLDAAKIDHVHAHFGTNAAEVAMLANMLGGPPWSFTAHGPEEFDKPQLLALSEKIRRASFVVAVSSFGRSQLFRHVEYSHWAKINVVHCGLEHAFYERSESRGTNVSRRLICVGRLAEQKGQLLLVEAARRLVDRGEIFELVLAGDGELRPPLEALIRHHDLATVVRITGWISSEQVREEILAARALVLPSFAEGLPVVLMEAMALARPVISTYVAGIPELIEPGKHGWLIPAGDVDALATAMQACLRALPGSLTQMGEAARVRVLQDHDIDHEAAKLMELFQSAGGTFHS